MDDRLRTKDTWELFWKNVSLPYLVNPDYDFQYQLGFRLPKTDKFSLIEIGCAPAGYMAWFNTAFGYKVSGVEYAEIAAATAKKNLASQGVQGDIIVEDFFTWDSEPGKYDVVFSSGFIEHFRDVSPVMERLCRLSSRFVVTVVPNIYGVNGAIRKVFNPKGYAEHVPIDIPALEAIHAQCGMRTLFCDYVGGAQFIRPGANRQWIIEHRYCSRVLHAPVVAFNRLSLSLGRHLNYTLRSKMLSATLMYIGEKPEA